MNPGEGYEPVIGLEVHVQLSTRTKMFCGCSTRFGQEPNTQTCPVCLGLPGALPAINRAAVECALRAGLAFRCQVASFTKFDRKNYYYPDLPKNYQISQYDLPICAGGTVEVPGEDEVRRVRLRRVHLEEDAGKNLHMAGSNESLVDLNRSGIPLLEIVSEPDLHSPRDVVAYLKSLRLVLLFLGVSDCNMEEGSLRCEPNISIRPRGSAAMGTRTEIKNLNSFANVERALEYEISRQVAVIESGGEVVPETLLFDPESGRTHPMRSKEEVHDYRYFPEPDLAPLRIDPSWVEEISASLPELPAGRLKRYREDLGLPFYDADIILQDRDVADYFEACVAGGGEPKQIANWVLTEVRREMNERKAGIRDLGVTPERLVELLKRIGDGTVARAAAQTVFRNMVATGRSAPEIIREEGLAQVSEDHVIEELVRKVIAAHPKAVADLKAGKKKAFDFLFGQAMRESRGRANPGLLRQLLDRALGSGRA